MAEELSQLDMLTGLLEGIERHSPSLGVEARDAVNQGTDREETHIEIDPRTGKKKEHTFRQRVPLTTEEALDRLLNLLTSRLVELPMAINSVSEELEQCFQHSNGSGQFTVELELGGAGDLLRDKEQETLRLESFDQDEIAKFRSRIETLRQLLGRASDRAN